MPVMPLRKSNTHTFYRTLYAGQMETVTLLKRDDNQGQSTVRALKVFNARRGQIFKTGETIQGDMDANHTTVWHLPQLELTRVGVSHINPLDRIVDSQNRYWQPEAPTTIAVKLFENYIRLDCLRVDPPA